ncbi:MAG: hypothetical protein P1R58_00375 [bacterium]|nr:hypothetical protein [bacterium]
MALITLATGSASAESWPVQGTIDLSSGFGDYRPGHFHGGVDIRTGGVAGWGVVSPVDGYVWRVKMSYSGYGKGLYIKGNDGQIYVFGHLSRLADKIRTPVRETQLNEKKYSVDIYFPKDSIPVKAGELVAHTGQSGSGPPHLHFEKRTADNVPINPLASGFSLDDKTPPAFQRISFKAADETSLFDDGTRQLFWNLTKGSGGTYRLDTLLYFNQPFGILLDCYDQMRPGGMWQAVPVLTLYIDGQEVYHSRFERLDFETTASVNLEFDYHEAINERKRVRRLFHVDGNRMEGSRSENKYGGRFGLSGNEKIGRHTARIVGKDTFGNESELTFDFLWGRPEGIFTLDSVNQPKEDTTLFSFTAVEGWQTMGIDSVQVILNRGDEWGAVIGQHTELDASGHLSCYIPGNRIDRAVLRLLAYSGKNGMILDPPFNGIVEGAKPNFKFLHEIVEDGLLLTIDAVAKVGYMPRVELYYQDQLLGTEHPRFFTMNKYIGLIPPRPEYQQIDRIDVSLSSDTAYHTTTFDNLSIVRVGAETDQTIAISDRMTVSFQPDNFYKPRFVELKSRPILRKALLHIDSELHEIFPEAFLCRTDFTIEYQFRSTGKFNSHGGICWLDKEKDSWVWLDNEFSDDKLTSYSEGGGSFATVIDYEPPIVSRLNIFNGKTYSNPNQPIRFIAKDSLSGLGEDENILLKLDGDWQIVDYDPETGRCYCEPSVPLTNGKHHLAIIITDRAGNVSEQYMNFHVKVKKGAKGRR